MMTAQALIALMPIILMAATVVVVMLVIAWQRNHRITAFLTAGGQLLALLSLGPVLNVMPQPVTAMLVMDSYAVFYMGLMLASGLAGTFLFYGYIDRFQGNREELYLLLLMATLGAMVLVASNDFVSLFLGLELMTLSLFGMVAYPVRERRALEAAIKYLILSAVSSAFMLFGIALVYAELGTFELPKISGLLPAPDGPRNLMLLAGGAMVMVGFGFKLSLVPFHAWTPDVYEGAPAPVTGFLATVSKGAVLALALRYFITSGAHAYPSLVLGLSLAAVLSILVGNWLALMQQNVKRILAYSSIAHFGYVLVGMIAAGPFGIEATSIYIVTYFVTTLGAFGVVGLLSTPISDRDADALWDYRGLFWRRPFLTGAFTVILLSLAGIPFTAGFIGKLYIVAAGVDQKLWVLLAAVVIGSAIGLFYYLRVMVTLYLPSTSARNPRLEQSWPQKIMGLATVVLTLALVWMGTYPAPLIAITRAMMAPLQ
ncbi:MAG: NADH-quinone oxidoreductase subunit NuoN [Nevskiales bacterium]